MGPLKEIDYIDYDKLPRGNRREYQNAYTKQYQKSPEQKEKHKEYYQKNKERIKSKAIEYYYTHKDNPDIMKKQNEKQNDKQKEYQKEKQKEYYQKNK